MIAVSILRLTSTMIVRARGGVVRFRMMLMMMAVIVRAQHGVG